jgi:drug/metabolite transporter (DMT)-like permease
MSSRPESQRTQALFMLLLANVFWGLSFPLIKAVQLAQASLLPQSSSAFVTAYALAPRFVLALGILLIGYRRVLRELRMKEAKQGLAIGLFSALGMLFQIDGMQFTSASTSAFLTQLYAIVIPIYLALRARKAPPWTVWVSSALVLAGVAILGRFDWRELHLGRGEVETLIGSMFFMGQILWLDRPEFSSNHVGRVTVIMFCCEAAAFLILTLATMPSPAALLVPWHSPAWVGFTLVLTVFCTVGAFLLMNTWQPKISATEAGLMYCAEPVFCSLMALFLPAWFSTWAGIDYANEQATRNLILGGGLITGANILIQLKPPPKS